MAVHAGTGCMKLHVEGEAGSVANLLCNAEEDHLLLKVPWPCDVPMTRLHAYTCW